MSEKVRAILAVIRQAMLSQDEYYTLSKVLYEHWIAMEHMKPLDFLLEHINSLQEEKEFKLGKKLDFQD